MQSHETACDTGAATPALKVESKANHSYSFTVVKDSRKRKIRGLWRRGEKLYMQTKVPGERSARRIPLKATTLEAARDEMADIKRKNHGEGLPSTGLRPLFSDYADRYLKFHETAADSGKKPRTVAREGHSLVHWKKKLGNVRLDKITTPMVAAFVKERLEAGIKPRTANIDVIVLRSVLKEAKEEGLIQRLPMEGLKPRKVKTPVRGLLTHAEFKKLCEEAQKCSKNGEQLADYLKLLAYCGARRDEALALKWEQVDFDRKMLCIGADGLSKNSQARFVNFNPELETHLIAMKGRRAPDTVWLFPSPQRGKVDKPARTFRESLLIARTNAALPWMGFHDLRHYFISMCVMSGIDFMTIAQWVGHQDGGVLIGKVYGHLLPEHRQRMAEKVVFSPSVVRIDGSAAA